MTKVDSSATEAVAEATRRLERLGNDLQVPVLLLIDEAHELSEDAATALVNAIIDSEGPVLIIAAGLSSAWDTMVFDTLTPASRMFLPINVRRLSDADACSVLRETAASGGVDWPGELVAAAASLANNIPAELQAIGSLLWDCGPNVSEDSTQRSMTRYATSRRQMINRMLSRMPREAVLVARELVSHGTRGERIPLLAVRAMTKDDDSFRSVMNILERTGLVDIDDDQIVSINIELQHFAQFLAVEPSKAQESPPALEV
ncbi:hypothetical protein [Micromonospora sp. U21]|uniref:hypothetical protein n=1 Tax=Micromonospora sp. U21 TaxID=2824899 RepID=UPI001B3788CE|nr:hypothetical protein [Micromonospora sp. U21]MBQ0901305.1 hypothetical protein [Micromonospora sp. U21]